MLPIQHVKEPSYTAKASYDSLAFSMFKSLSSQQIPPGSPGTFPGHEKSVS